MSDLRPVSPSTVTVLGSRVSAASPAWRGLDLSRAILREKNTAAMALLGPMAPPDHHLDVPWCHPDDQPGGWRDGFMYRVRPRRKGWRFVQIDGTWMVEGAVPRLDMVMRRWGTQRCIYCDGVPGSVDHIFPRRFARLKRRPSWMASVSDPANLAPACVACNQAKGGARRARVPRA